MIEFRNLSHFIVACENESLTRAAEALNIAPSTLSASLKTLEDDLGLSLFQRLGSGLYPRASARWLFRAGLPLLLLEAHCRRRFQDPGLNRPRIIALRIRPKFTIGRITKAMLRAIAVTGAAEPEVLVLPVWTEEDQPCAEVHWVDDLDAEHSGTITLEMTNLGEAPSSDGLALMVDPWMLACRFPAAGPDFVATCADVPDRTVMVPALPQETLTWIEAHLRQCGLNRMRVYQDHPGSLPRLMNDHPDGAFLLPRSAVSERLGLSNVRVIHLDDPAFATSLFARGSEPVAASTHFLARLRDALAADESDTMFRPELTSRRLRYFNLTHRLRSVSSAARAANVAQPALSQQLRKLELTLETRLFDRRSDGVWPTVQSGLLAPAARILEAAVRELKVSAMSASEKDGGRLSLGVLPSVSQHGFMIGQITQSILSLRRRYPGLKVTVQEGPNSTLQDWIIRGAVGLAIVETGPPHLPRLPLGAAEELAVIANPGHMLLPPGPVRLQDVVKAPLAMPSALFGLRQLLDAAASAQRLELRPSLEIDALPMLIALLTHEPLCTILPPSAVRKELEFGELCAHLIVDPPVIRRLFVIYSGERTLTEVEREFVGLLRSGLSLDSIKGLSAPVPSHVARAPITALVQ